MSSVSLEELFHTISKDYNALWDLKLRGRTLEIVTPHSTTSDKFVSVFVVEQDGSFVVTDGGYLHKFEYIEQDVRESHCYRQAVSFFEQHYAVRRVIDKLGTIICYKKADNPALLSSLVHDMASFITGTVNAQQIAIETDSEIITRRQFTSQANTFLRSAFAGREVDFQGKIHEGIKVRFSAVIKSRSRISLVNYITGSDESYFSSSISRANMGFELVQDSHVDERVMHKITLLDDFSSGYEASKFAGHIRILRKNSEVIPWSEKQRLASIVEASA